LVPFLRARLGGLLGGAAAGAWAAVTGRSVGGGDAGTGTIFGCAKAQGP
jgi:hypothetical protein